jgi:hypothetical protein
MHVPFDAHFIVEGHAGEHAAEPPPAAAPPLAPAAPEAPPFPAAPEAPPLAVWPPDPSTGVEPSESTDDADPHPAATARPPSTIETTTRALVMSGTSERRSVSSPGKRMESSYREPSAGAPIVTRVRLVARGRLVDSYFIPSIALLLFLGLGAAFAPGEAGLATAAFFAVVLVASVVLVARVLRRSVIELSHPGGVLRWTNPGEKPGGHELEVARIAKVRAAVVDRDDIDATLYEVVFDLVDGGTVKLCDDPNVWWEKKHAARVAGMIGEMIGLAGGPAGGEA